MANHGVGGLMDTFRVLVASHYVLGGWQDKLKETAKRKVSFRKGGGCYDMRSHATILEFGVIFLFSLACFSC